MPPAAADRAVTIAGAAATATPAAAPKAPPAVATPTAATTPIAVAVAVNDIEAQRFPWTGRAAAVANRGSTRLGGRTGVVADAVATADRPRWSTATSVDGTSAAEVASGSRDW